MANPATPKTPNGGEPARPNPATRLTKPLPTPAPGTPNSEILPSPPNPVPINSSPLSRPRRQPPPHLLQLRPSRHLLSKKRSLNPVKQPLKPPHQLSLRNPQLSIRRRSPIRERKRQPL